MNERKLELCSKLKWILYDPRVWDNINILNLVDYMFDCVPTLYNTLMKKHLYLLIKDKFRISSSVTKNPKRQLVQSVTWLHLAMYYHSTDVVNVTNFTAQDVNFIFLFFISIKKTQYVLIYIHFADPTSINPFYSSKKDFWGSTKNFLTI